MIYILIILLIVGFGLLIKGAGFLVDGAVIVAAALRVSPLIIGLTIVAFGTSTPELAVNIVTSLSPQNSDIGLGNIIGSNIANIGLIVGVAAMISPLVVKKILVTREIPFMFLSAIVFLTLVADKLLDRTQADVLTRADGVVLLLFFSIFVYYLATTILAQRTKSLNQEFKKGIEGGVSRKDLAKGILFIILGIVGVAVGGKLVVDNAAGLARHIGASEILIGLTIVAIGTSLPELATSLVAAFKKQSDISVGNIVGSNIFNTFFVLGINSLISPVPFQEVWFIDSSVMILFSALLFVMALNGGKIKKSEGALMLGSYLFYIVYTIYRG